MEDKTTFTITCTMRTRWVPHFLARLKHMQRLGGMGSSRWVHFYADGDGDFRPKFEWSEELPEETNPIRDTGDKEFWFDAG
jgi:hypothetical protein